MDKIMNDARVYTDLQGLDSLRAKSRSNPGAVKKEVAQQFEALLFQMVLRSMRDANNVFSSGLLGSNDMELYQDMFDKQLSLSLSQQGLGFAKMIEESIDRQSGQFRSEKTPASPLESQQLTKMMIHPAKPASAPVIEKEKSTFDSPKEFIRSMWHHAKQAAGLIGLHPGVLLAQAALETNWGKKIVTLASGGSSCNLFNIKSDPTWNKSSTAAATLEEKNGLIVKEKAHFKNYESYHESFMDYVRLISNNPRYKKALANVEHPKAYTEALQEAGYATDSQYSSKIMNIMKSSRFNEILKELNLI